MHRTRIKICGVRTPDIARAAADGGADAIGVVFAPGSPREVTLREAEAGVAAPPACVEPIGLFVNAEPEYILSVAAALRLRCVQLQGDESPEFAAALAPLRVIKALHVRDDDAALANLVQVWRAGCPNLSGLHWDAPPPTEALGTAVTGGHGRSFDWRRLRAIATEANSGPPTILAGGLTPENVAAAIATVSPYAVDVSSGVESARGVKDPQRIAAFCEAVRAADRG
jgi:phosphoribosylanthranilate isomerase